MKMEQSRGIEKRPYFLGQIARLQRTFTEEDVKLCTALTRDINSIYFEVTPSVLNKRFQGPILPGLLSEGLITEVITKELPGTACLLLHKELVYCQAAYIGDTITAELEIIDMNSKQNWITEKVTCYNQFGKEVIKGQVVVLLISDGE